MATEKTGENKLIWKGKFAKILKQVLNDLEKSPSLGYRSS